MTSPSGRGIIHKVQCAPESRLGGLSPPPHRVGPVEVDGMCSREWVEAIQRESIFVMADEVEELETTERAKKKLFVARRKNDGVHCERKVKMFFRGPDKQSDS